MRSRRGMWVAVCAVLAAGCGDDGGGGGGGDDGAPDDDGAPADAAFGTVTVTVLGDTDEPVEGALAIFSDADGEIVAEVTTDAAGVATARMAPGGSVTTIRQLNTIEVASTYLDLWPDATIVSQFKNGMKPREDVAISYPAATSPIDYRAVVGCYPDFGGNGFRMTTGLSVAMTVDSRCGDDFDVLVIARRTGLPTQSLLGTSVSRPSVSLAGVTYTDNAPLTAAFTDVPDVGANAISASLRVWFRQEVLNTAPIVTGDLVGGSITFDAPTLANHAVDLFLFRTDAGGQYYFERMAPGATELTRSLAGRIQPWVLSPVVDLDARTMVWQEVTPPGVVPPHVVLASVRYMGSGRAVIWNVIAPAARLEAGPGADMRMLRLPDVPGDRLFEPLPGDLIMLRQITTVRADDAAADVVRGVIEPALSYDFHFFRAPEITFFSLTGSTM